MNKNEFVDTLDYFFNENIDYYKNEIIKDLDCDEKNYHFSGFLNPIFQNGMYLLNKEFLINKINSCDVAVRFKHDQPNYSVFNFEDIPESDSEHYNRYLEKFYNLYQEFEDEFWNDQNNILEFNSLANFNGYENSEIDQDEVFNYMLMECNYNEEGWVKYIKDLIDVFFQDYYLQKDGFKIQLNFNEKLLRKSLHEGKFLHPKLNFEITSNILNEKKQLLLSIPFENFFTQLLTLDSFIANYRIKKRCDGKYEMVQLFDVTDLDGKVFIENDETFIKKLKKHLYYYFCMVSFYTKSHFNYIKKSLAQTLLLLSTPTNEN